MLYDTICNNGSFHQESLSHAQLPCFQTAYQEPSTHTRYAAMNTFNSSSSSSSIVMLHAGVEGGDIPFCYPATWIVRVSVIYQVPVIHLHVVRALVYRTYSNYLVSITANRHGQQEFCCTACCFYATCGARHKSKTCRAHQLTTLVPLGEQLSRTYSPIVKLVQIHLDVTELLL